MVYAFLAEGFEEVEAVAPIDLLRRAGIDVKTVSVSDEKVVVGARKIPVVCDMTLEEVKADEAELVILPGGMPGTINLLNCKPLMELVDSLNAQGKRIAAICAAPALLLGERGLLKGKKATCYPGMEDHFVEAKFSEDSVVTDGNITTSRGLGTAVKFGLELVRIMCGEEAAKELAEGVVA